MYQSRDAYIERMSTHVMIWSQSSRVASLDRNQTTQQHFFSQYLPVFIFISVRTSFKNSTLCIQF
jgi:hypothetical protein